MTGHTRWSDIRPDATPACRSCGADWTTPANVNTGPCTQVACVCGAPIASFGPVGCPACSPYRWPRIAKIRRAYRARHR